MYMCMYMCMYTVYVYSFEKTTMNVHVLTMKNTCMHIYIYVKQRQKAEREGLDAQSPQYMATPF